MKRTPLKQKTPLRAKKPWQPKRTALQKTSLNRCGKVGRANLEANDLIAKQKPKQYCEIERPGCLGNKMLTIAHRHKRAWYKANVELLSDKKQWVTACTVCHDRIEHDTALTEKVFMKLRGKEDKTIDS